MCRPLSNAARPFVFRDITLNSEARFEDLERLIRETPHLGGWIHRLSIDAREYRRLQQDWVFRAIDILHPQITQLHTLELLGLYECPKFSQTGFYRKLSFISTLQNLRILECGLPHSILQSLICSFPLLSSLAIHRSRSSFYEHHQITELFRPHLTNLCLYDDWGEIEAPLLEWAITSHQPLSLRSLNMDVVRQRDVPRAQNVITQTGAHLERLILGRFITDGMVESTSLFTPFVFLSYPKRSSITNLTLLLDLHPHEAPMYLSQCTRLRHLGFLGSLNHSIITLIANLPSPESLRTLTLGISDRKIWTKYNGRYKLLDRHLRRIEFMNLEEVHFKCASLALDEGQWRENLSQAFPTLAERNLIRVSLT